MDITDKHYVIYRGEKRFIRASSQRQIVRNLMAADGIEELPIYDDATGKPWHSVLRADQKHHLCTVCHDGDNCSLCAALRAADDIASGAKMDPLGSGRRAITRVLMYWVDGAGAMAPKLLGQLIERLEGSSDTTTCAATGDTPSALPLSPRNPTGTEMLNRALLAEQPGSMSRGDQVHYYDCAWAAISTALRSGNYTSELLLDFERALKPC